VRGLSIADQQIVEIAKALSFDARVLIMDEPTAALSGHEVERLFGVVRTLRQRGAAVLFISHRLEEIFAICDTVTVLRDGEVTHDGEVAGLTTDELVRRMVGRELSQLFPKQPAEIGAPVLQVQRLTREGVFTDVSFEVRRGEIVALAGLVGAGRSEVARAIFGIDKPDGGHVEVDGVRLKPGSPAQAMRVGVGLVPEDRRQQGLVMELSIERNSAAGWGSCSLFSRGDGQILGYLETEDFEAARAAMEQTDVNTRWQAEMAPFLERELEFRRLEEVFHLD
jgi:rhamnose transport system ATP-binding protein